MKLHFSQHFKCKWCGEMFIFHCGYPMGQVGSQGLEAWEQESVEHYLKCAYKKVDELGQLAKEAGKYLNKLGGSHEGA